MQAYVATHPSPPVLEHIAIPRFDPANGLHLRLAALSQRAHALAAAGDTDALAAVEEEVDQAAAELWGITAEELAEL